MNAIRILMMIVLLAGLLLPAAVAFAGEDGYEAPEIDYRPPWPAIGYSLVFLLGVAAVAFKNARRTHLD